MHFYTINSFNSVLYLRLIDRTLHGQRLTILLFRDYIFKNKNL